MCIHRQKDHIRMLKILESMSEFDGLWKHTILVSVFRMLKLDTVRKKTVTILAQRALHRANTIDLHISGHMVYTVGSSRLSHRLRHKTSILLCELFFLLTTKPKTKKHDLANNVHKKRRRKHISLYCVSACLLTNGKKPNIYI